MDSSLIVGLQITVVGMSLVFGAIVLLWGMMAVLVRLTDQNDKPSIPGSTLILGEQVEEIHRKRRAALAAVAVALAQKQAVSEPHEFPLPPTPLVSAWQAVMRTRMLNKRFKIR